MKKIFSTVVVLATLCIASAQEVGGVWSGILDLGEVKIPMFFNIEKSDSGFLATLDVPVQSIKGLPAKKVEFEQGEIVIEFEKMIRARYWGEIAGDSLIEGKFFQNGMALPLNLRPAPDGLPKLNRPQEPKAPFPYTEKEVTFVNDKAEVTLYGTLTIPQGKGRFPAVILISGSGPQDRNEQIFGHRPFFVIADFLTRNGIAVLRFDERGVGKSTGEFKKATTKDFYEDALVGIDFLRSQKEINPKKVGLIGHSEGGTIAFMAAGEGNVDFAVSLAGAALRGDSILVKQNYDILVASGVSKEVALQYVDLLREIFKLQNSHTQQYIKDNMEEIAKTIFDVKKEIIPQNLLDNAKMLITTDNDWLAFFRKNDPANYIARIKCPLLAINGTKDLQVDAELNLGVVERLLPSAKVVRYDNLNHLLQECQTGMVNEYGTIEQTIAPHVLDDILNWIKQN